MQNQKVIVDLTLGCVSCSGGGLSHGANYEYPHGWEGGVVTEKSVPHARLTYVRFNRPFIGKGIDGRPERKTDRQNGMLIPEWLLRMASPV